MGRRKNKKDQKEKEIHEEAVRIRKMTDDQLVHTFNEHYRQGYETGYQSGLSEKTKDYKRDVAWFIGEVEKIRGIGVITVSRIKQSMEGGTIPK